MTTVYVKIVADSKTAIYGTSIGSINLTYKILFSNDHITYDENTTLLSDIIIDNNKNPLNIDYSDKYIVNNSYNINFDTTVFTINTTNPNANYSANIEYVNSVLTITKKDLTIKADDKTKIYDKTIFDTNNYSVTITGFISGDTIGNSLTNTLSFSGDAITATTYNINNYVIIPSGYSSDNYNLIFENGVLTITKKLITVSTISINKSYTYNNSIIYSDFYVYTGLISGDTILGSPNLLINDSTIFPKLNVGSYNIKINNIGTLSSDNYSFSNTNINNTLIATLTITKKDLIIKADDKTKIYDKIVFDSNNYSVTITGFIYGDTIENSLSNTLSFSGTAITATTYNANGYSIIPSGYMSDNYNLIFQNGLLTITKKDLTIKADDKTKIYDKSIFNINNYTVTITGFISGDTIGNSLTNTLSFSGDAITATTYNVSGYTIIPSGYTSNNYNITFQNGTLMITKKDLTIKADDKTKIYDKSIFNINNYTVTITGFIIGDTIANSLTNTLSFSGDAITATTYNIIGYTIIPSGYTSNNYNITFQNGVLTITKKLITVSTITINKSYTYGDSIIYSDFYVYTGLISGDTISGNPNLLINDSSIFPKLIVGSYNIKINDIGTLSSDNYSFNNTNINNTLVATLTITKAILNVVPIAPSSNYNYGYNLIPYINLYDFTGFKYDDTISEIPITNIKNGNNPAIYLTHTTISGNSLTYIYNESKMSAGTYNISINSVSRLNSTNYSFSILNSTVPQITILKVEITINVNTTYQPYYGDINIQNSLYSNKISITGTKYTDTKSNISGTIIFKKSDNTLISSTDYPNTYNNVTLDLTGYISQNYTFKLLYDTYTIIIQKAQLTLRPKNQTFTITYGDIMDSTYLYNLFEVVGFVNNDGTQNSECEGSPAIFLYNSRTYSYTLYNNQVMDVNDYGIYVDNRFNLLRTKPTSHYSSSFIINNSYLGLLKINKISFSAANLSFTWDKYMSTLPYGIKLTNKQLNATATLNPYKNTPIGNIIYYGQRIDNQIIDSVNFNTNGTPDIGIYIVSAKLIITDTNYVSQEILATNSLYNFEVIQNYPEITHWNPLPILKGSQITNIELSATTNTSIDPSKISYYKTNGDIINSGDIINDNIEILEKINDYSNTNFFRKYTFRKIKLDTV
jgi:hypothetical protein